LETNGDRKQLNTFERKVYRRILGPVYDNEMWRVWVRRGGCIGSWWGNRRERAHWGDLGVDGWIILGHLQEVGCGYMDWIGLAKDRDRWWTLVSAVMNLRVP